MSFHVQVLEDSINQRGQRLITWEYRAPRRILAEINTHCALARNAESSRAVPVAKRIRTVRENPFIPLSFGKNQKGMQAYEQLSEENQAKARDIWLRAMEAACGFAEELEALYVHKQEANRLIEPFAFNSGIITGADTISCLQNFFALRTDGKAEPHFQKLANMMLDAARASTPRVLQDSTDWHLPLVTAEERELYPIHNQLKISVGRCARVSYDLHMREESPTTSIERHDRMLEAGDMSPFEHQARTGMLASRGKFPGFVLYRHTIRGEVRKFKI